MHVLLEKNGTESRVESTDTLLLEDTTEAAQQTASEGGLGDKTNTGGLERAKGDVGHELGASRRGEVDGSTVVGSSLVAKGVDGLLLEELVTTELEGTLQEVTGSGRAETGQKSASTLLLDDLAEATDHAAVVGRGVKLDTGLDAAIQCRDVSQWVRDCFCIDFDLHIERSDSAMGNAATTRSSKGEPTI